MKINFERLIQARDALALTQDQLAQKARVAKRSIVSWESGKPITPDNLRKLSQALGLPVEHFTLSIYPKLGSDNAAALRDIPSMSRFQVEDGGGADMSEAQKKVLRHLCNVLAEISDDEARLNWLLCELEDKGPLVKFRKHPKP